MIRGSSKYELPKSYPIKKGWLRKTVIIVARYFSLTRRSKYVWIHVIDHPIFGSGRIREHRLVMMEKLNRKLTRKEIVHHDDDDTTNNDPNNLILLSSNAAHNVITLKRWWTKPGIKEKRSQQMQGNTRALGMRHTKAQRKRYRQRAIRRQRDGRGRWT